jgi:hypothetical protein
MYSTNDKFIEATTDDVFLGKRDRIIASLVMIMGEVKHIKIRSFHFTPLKTTPCLETYQCAFFHQS